MGESKKEAYIYLENIWEKVLRASSDKDLVVESISTESMIPACHPNTLKRIESGDFLDKDIAECKVTIEVVGWKDNKTKIVFGMAGYFMTVPSKENYTPFFESLDAAFEWVQDK